MSLSKNSILGIQKSTTQIKLKYDSVYTSSFDGYAEGLTFGSASINALFGMNVNPYTRDSTGSMGRIYKMIKHSYYQEYLSGSILGTGSAYNWSQQSTAVSGSSEYEYRYIPTGSTDKIAVIYIPPEYCGEQISKTTFNLKPIIGTTYDIWDDGNGNLVDRANQNLHVGNIIYSQGVIIITDPEYAPAFVIQTAPPAPYYRPTSSLAAPTAGYTNSTSTDQFVQFTDDIW